MLLKLTHSFSTVPTFYNYYFSINSSWAYIAYIIFVYSIYSKIIILLKIVSYTVVINPLILQYDMYCTLISLPFRACPGLATYLLSGTGRRGFLDIYFLFKPFTCAFQWLILTPILHKRCTVAVVKWSLQTPGKIQKRSNKCFLDQNTWLTSSNWDPNNWPFLWNCEMEWYEQGYIHQCSPYTHPHSRKIPRTVQKGRYLIW